MNKTANHIKIETQKLARLERSLMLEKERNRKKDTRNKIQLGGLVIKAGIHNFSKAEILGLLIEAKELLNDNTKFNLSNCRLRGDKAFRESKPSTTEQPSSDGFATKQGD